MAITDAILIGDNGKAYFFRGPEYIQYDIAADVRWDVKGNRADSGYPLPVDGNWGRLGGGETSPVDGMDTQKPDAGLTLSKAPNPLPELKDAEFA
jgi:hypothetical protein